MLKVIKNILGGPFELKTREGFHELYEREKDYIRSSVYWMIRHEEIDDIVQETFIKAWKSRDSFKGDSQLKTWLYRIAMNCAHDHYRKDSRYTQITDDLENEVLIEGSSVNLEMKDLIDLGIQRMSWEQREVFVLFYKLEWSQKEIAQLQQVPIGTVKSRLNKAKVIFTEFVKAQEVAYANQ